MLSRHDAIGQAVIDTWRLLNTLPGIEAKIVTIFNELSDIPAEIVGGLPELLMSATFMAADLIVYHFGIHNQLFDALLAGNGHARQIVRFHNVTPMEYVRPQDAPLIERSMRQLWNFQHADAIWADSPTNAAALLEQGIQHPVVEVIPLVVDSPARGSLSHRPEGPVEILFLGRFVQSKGILDLLQALEVLFGRSGPVFRLRLAGNQAFSDPAYVRAVRQASARFGRQVEFLGAVDEAVRDRLLREAHILAVPSYHEGFCKPVLEGMRAGCIPVGYAAYNLPDICAGLGRLVPTGDIAALADALAGLVDDVAAIGASDTDRLRIDRGATRTAEFERLVDSHIARFEFEPVRRLTLASVQRLLSVEGGGGMNHASERSGKPAPIPPFALRQEHVEGARLFAGRREMVCGLRLPAGGVIAEIGVALGDFSEFLLQTLTPRRFVAIDIWTMHEWPEHWGQRSEMLFQGKTHRGFYEDRFRPRGDQVVIEAGLSYDALERFPDACFDMIYIDAGHDYDNVRKDALVSARKIKPDGTLIFNDYIMYDHLQQVEYGVVQAVNQLVVDAGWRVVGFALDHIMFCDIAIRRPC
jgi:glycosyltransferase involved in cell wall biosynthesis